MKMWKREGFEKFFTSDVKVLYLHDSITKSISVNVSRKMILAYDFVVTTYDVIMSTSKKYEEWKTVCEYGDEHTLMKGKIVSINARPLRLADDANYWTRLLFNTPWQRVICDESQRFSNPKTMLYKSMMSLYGKYKLCLTGTPIRNYDLDIWAQLRFLGYNGIEKAKDWKIRGLSLMTVHKLKDAILSIDYVDTDIVLPDKNVSVVRDSFSGTEKEVYNFAIKSIKRVFDLMLAKKVNYACDLALFTRLRQICIAPYLITDESKRNKKISKKEGETDSKEHLEELYEGPLWKWVKDKTGTAGIKSVKIRLIIDCLKNKIKKGEKVLIFSIFTSCLDLITEAIDHEFGDGNFLTEMIDGTTPNDDRDIIIKNFHEDKFIRALLLTYKVGSEA
jgi:SNF2 family DNA or RNA helicase